MDEMKKKKIAVVILSTEYQQGHSKCGEKTHFVDKLAEGTKLHTIRGSYENWRKKAEQVNAGEMELSIRIWSGMPYKSKQYEVARVQQLCVQRFEGSYGTDDAKPLCWVDGKAVDAAEIAKNDGLELEDWIEWIFGGSNLVEGGAILQLTGFRYT